MKVTDKITLMNGDCLELMKNIPDCSIDLILTDPPYGTIKGAKLDGWNNNSTYWDNVIDFYKMWSEIDRILRVNGKCVLFSQEPFTSNLIHSAITNVPFSYRNIWLKNHFANPLSSKKAPVNYFEDICVFQKVNDFQLLHPLRKYSESVFKYIGLDKKDIISKIGSKVDHFFRYKSSQFDLCTGDTYNELITVFNIDKMVGFMSFDMLLNINKKYESVFNLWEGQKIKSNVFKYSKDTNNIHPTQKPVLLLEDLIKTFSNENDIVLDFTMGSGSTGVACLNTNRKFIGIELDKNYFSIAEERIKNHTSQQKLF